MKYGVLMTPESDEYECAIDVCLDSMSEIEKKFIYWIHYLQGTLTTIKVELCQLREMETAHLLYDIFKSKYEIFTALFIYNLCSVIALKISKLIFKNNNELSLEYFINYCDANKKVLFNDKLTELVLEDLKKRIEFLNGNSELLKKIRDKVLAHNEKIIINKPEVVNNWYEQIYTSDFVKISNDIEALLNIIWEIYRGKKLWFHIDGEDDINELISDLKSYNSRNHS